MTAMSGEGAEDTTPGRSHRAYVDANLIVRLLTRDEPAMASQAFAVFAAAESGDVTRLVSTLTLAEVVWALASYYKLERADIANRLIAFVNADGLEVEAQDEVLLALAVYHDKSIDFADALLAARMRLVGPAVIYSFDHHFDQVPGIQRIDPAQES